MRTTNRLLALDVFRGITIASMILVNTPGSWSYVYPPLRHASWHGCTPTDLIFPFFLFIVGVAMAWSLSRFENRISAAAARKIGRRAALIFVIGLLLNAFPFQEGPADLRILGVLQRIALAYGLAAFACLRFKLKGLIILSAAVLTGYWLLLIVFGGGDPYTLETNLVRRIDLALLGEDHLWDGLGIAFDPEGLLSTLPAAVTVILGYLAGGLIRSASGLNRTVRMLLLSGLAGLLLGGIWSTVLPLNKSLWTGSYVLYTAGWAALFLALLLWIIDIRGLKKWTYPFVVFGLNPLLLYMLASIWVDIYIFLIKIPAGDGSTVNAYDWLYTRIFLPLAGDMNGSLLFAVAHIALFWVILFVMYRKKLFIKI